MQGSCWPFAWVGCLARDCPGALKMGCVGDVASSSRCRSWLGMVTCHTLLFAGLLLPGSVLPLLCTLPWCRTLSCFPVLLLCAAAVLFYAAVWCSQIVVLMPTLPCRRPCPTTPTLLFSNPCHFIAPASALNRPCYAVTQSLAAGRLHTFTITAHTLPELLIRQPSAPAY